MKKIQFISMMALVIMALCSCTNTDYQKAIPANATLVVKMDVRSISEKSDFKNSKVKTLLDGALATVVKGKDLKNVKEYVDDPMMMGIDFSMPIYFFMVGEETFGLTMKVNDVDDLKDFILLLKNQGVASKPVEKDGLMCGTLVDDINYAYDGNSLLLLASMTGEGSATMRMTRELMNQKEKDSFISTELFDRMNEEEKDIVTCSNGEVPKGMGALSEVFSTLLLPPSVKAKDLYFVSWGNFEDGRMMFSSHVYGKTEKAQKALQEMNNQLGAIEGKYIGRASDKTLMWAAANVKGDWMLGKLKGVKEIKELLFLAERAIDIEQMLRTVDGDMAVELRVEDTDYYAKDPFGYVAYAQLKNTDFLADVDDWKKDMKEFGMTMQDKGENQYVLIAERDTIGWGVQDKDLYFVSAKSNVQEKGGNSSLDAYKGDIQKNKFYLWVDLTKIPWEQFAQKNLTPVFGEPLSKLNVLVVKAPSADEVTLTLELKNKDENILKQLLK